MCEHKQKDRQTSSTSTSTSTPRSFRQAVDNVDIGRFYSLDLPPFPQGTEATGTLSKSLKRVFLLRYDAAEKAQGIFKQATALHMKHLQHHPNHVADQGLKPNCAEHNAELRPLKNRYEAAKREFRRLDKVFNGIIGFEFDLQGNGEIEVFQGGKFVFKKPETSEGVADANLEGLPPYVAGFVQAIIDGLPGKVTVERVDANSSSATHAEILELIRQFDHAADSRKGGQGFDDGRPAPSHFAQQAAAAERNGQ